jgi:2-polyprenyl-3-methyl-5-hydroxy-6-metoxy-1,4-benzoquinol methylase
MSLHEPETYEKYRPDYPAALFARTCLHIEHLFACTEIESKKLRLLDIGCGTGISMKSLNAALVERGISSRVEIQGIEPDDKLLSRVRGFPAQKGWAESLPWNLAEFDGVQIG